MLFWLAVAVASEPADEVVEVKDVGTPASAGEVRVEGDAIDTQPARSADDLMRALPGLQASAHGGRGKAYQYLYRGFDAVHGSDIAVNLDGVPLNEPGNVHGHGYLDLHFLPLRAVGGVVLTPGPGRADVGDHGVAATADFHLGVPDVGGYVGLGGGTDRSGAFSLAWRPEGGDQLVAAEVSGGLGAGEQRGFRLARAAVGGSWSRGVVSWRGWLVAYDGAFQSPGVLRADDVDAEGFYGSYGLPGGGRSSRALVAQRVTVGGTKAQVSVLVWGGLRQLRLDQNFTGWWRDEVGGDATRQTEQRAQGGLRVSGQGVVSTGLLHARLRAGVDLRGDVLTQQQRALSVDGVEGAVSIDADQRYTTAAAWTDAELSFGRWVVVTPGLRAESLQLGLRRRIDDDGAGVAAPTWARSSAPVALPKVGVVVRPHEGVEVVLGYGRGYRSPEARGIEDGQRAPVSLADAVEGGVRVAAGPVSVRTAGFFTAVDNELVFDHLAARFLASGATRRVGVEAGMAVAVHPAVRLEAAVTWADGRYVASRAPVPFAPRWTGQAGVRVDGAEIGPVTLSGGLSARWLGPRPLPQGFVSRHAVAGALTATLSWRSWCFDLMLDNAFFNRWRDGEYVYPSRFDLSRPRSELPVHHLSAGDPTALRLMVGWRW